MMRQLLGPVILALLTVFASCTERSFVLKDDRFVVNGEPTQLISGCLHYFRVPRPYWVDRIARLKAMGLNTIEFYVPWNWHERSPGEFTFEGEADLEAFLDAVADAGMYVLLRPGPYICAEWDFGGLPFWLASTKVEGGRRMDLRSDDAAYLAHVQRWWGVLFERVKPYLWEHGGPIVMVQIENEYGFCGPAYGPERTAAYLRALVGMAREGLGDSVVLYTTDPPGNAPNGTLPGDEVFTAVDFGAGWTQLDDAFGVQAKLNPRGQSPPICTEFYTGWLTHWGEHMANTSAATLAHWYRKLLTYRGNSGSVSFYMAHGGTNFGFWAGANSGDKYAPHITSYDYDAPISEAGAYGQPGIGGPSKFHMLRAVVQELYPDRPLPDVPPPPPVAYYGDVAIEGYTPLLSVMTQLAGQAATATRVPDIMEEYGQRGGVIVYRITFGAERLARDAVLRLAIHDFAKVFINGHLAGSISRNTAGGNADGDGRQSLLLPAALAAGAGDSGGSDPLVLDVLVEGMGHSNFGCDWDLKGIVNPEVTLDGIALEGWTVYPLDLESSAALSLVAAAANASIDALFGGEGRVDEPQVLSMGPTFFKGSFQVAAGAVQAGSGYPADTFLSMPGWTKGVVFVNGVNLGWYWPRAGPQMRLYIPGTVLREGANELIVLEMDAIDYVPPLQLELVDSPDFSGPQPIGDAAAPPAPPPSRQQLFAAQLQELTRRHAVPLQSS